LNIRPAADVFGRYVIWGLRAALLLTCCHTELKFLLLPAREYIIAVTQAAPGRYAIWALRAALSKTLWTVAKNSSPTPTKACITRPMEEEVGERGDEEGFLKNGD